MRRLLMVLSLFSVSIISIGCGEKATTITNASTNSGSNMTGANSTSTGATDGTGPQTQGIGGNTNDSGAVSGNTYTVPPGFNKNGDRGSAQSVGNANTH